MRIIDVFNTPIIVFKLEFNSKDLIKYILKCSKEEGRQVSNVGGWQSNDLLNNKNYLELYEQIQISLDQLKEKLGIKKNKKIIIDSMWANLNKFKDYNNVHWHPASFLSGVVYLKAPKNSGNITFLHPALESVEGCYWKSEDFNHPEQNTFISKSWALKPEDNIMYIFPSWLKHTVEPNLSKEKRISIAFNTAIKVVNLKK